MKAIEVYQGSDGDATKAYYALLMTLGPLGEIAVNLFRAQKCSTRAKAYRGGIRGKGRYKDMAYNRKDWSLGNLVGVLERLGDRLGIVWGWGRDDSTPGFEWVLYVDLPTGQASFHAPARKSGPDYAGEWDGKHLSESRIIHFCDRVWLRVPAACVWCGCREDSACIADDGETCAWSVPGVCTFCAEHREDVDRGGVQERALVAEMGGW